MSSVTLKTARIAIYARYSSDRQSEASIDDQVRRCRQHIEKSGGDPERAEVFADYAVSGASIQRPDFERMMEAVSTNSVDVILTEDLSRISRDFADSAQIFKRLQFAQVPLIGIADGVNTGEKNALLTFGVKSLINDLYLADLADKTLRGLKGRALADFATGGVPYGYITVRTGDEFGSAIQIHPEQAGLLLRIFRLYEAGHSYGSIATILNREKIPAPRAKTKHRGNKGWVDTTIRAMLDNEKYIGIWKYNETTWVKVPGTNKRKPRKNPESEVITRHRPELRIIPEDLWQAVRARRQGGQAQRPPVLPEPGREGPQVPS